MSEVIESDLDQPARNANGRENILQEEHLDLLTDLEKRYYDNMKQELIDEYREIYNIFDEDGSESISDTEITKVMRTLGQNPSEDEVQQIIL